MSLVEIARYSDVYEAELAAAFLESHGIEVLVTERFQTTVDPLMQRALGIRLMGREVQAVAARDLLSRARAGEFATAEGDDLPRRRDAGTRTTGTIMALVTASAGVFWGTSLPRRLKPVHWIGVVLGLVLFVLPLAWLWIMALGEPTAPVVYIDPSPAAR